MTDRDSRTDMLEAIASSLTLGPPIEISTSAEEDLQASAICRAAAAGFLGGFLLFGIVTAAFGILT